MFEGTLGALATLLAFAGGVALVSRLVRSALWFVLRAAEVTAATTLAEASARRGDVTGMIERRVAVAQARRDRRSALLLAILWLGWIAIPIFGGWTREAFAFASVLWLAPKGARAVKGSVVISRSGSSGAPEG